MKVMTQDIGKLVRDAEARLQEARRGVAYKFGVPVDELRQDSDVSRVVSASNIGAGAPVAYNWMASRDLTLGQKVASGGIDHKFYFWIIARAFQHNFGSAKFVAPMHHIHFLGKLG